MEESSFSNVFLGSPPSSSIYDKKGEVVSKSLVDSKGLPVWKTTKLVKRSINGVIYLNNYKPLKLIARGSLCTVKLCVREECKADDENVNTSCDGNRSSPVVSGVSDINASGNVELCDKCVEKDKFCGKSISGDSSPVLTQEKVRDISFSHPNSDLGVNALRTEHIGMFQTDITAIPYKLESSNKKYSAYQDLLAPEIPGNTFLASTSGKLNIDNFPSERGQFMQEDCKESLLRPLRNEVNMNSVNINRSSSRGGKVENNYLCTPWTPHQVSPHINTACPFPLLPPTIPQDRSRNFCEENSTFRSSQNNIVNSTDQCVTKKDNESSPMFFALKCYRKSKLLRCRDFALDSVTGKLALHNRIGQVTLEMKLMQTINHPRCVKCHEILDSVDANGKIYLVLDYVECGAILLYLNDRYTPVLHGMDTLSEEVSKCLIKDLLEGLVYLHKKLGVAHRDIKPENILMDRDGRVKICDFGLAEYMDSNGNVRSTKGTYYFMPPEAVALPAAEVPYQGHDGQAADVWSVGITLWAMLFGTLPFSGLSMQELFCNIEHASYEFPKYPIISVEAKEAINKLLCKDFKKRISAQEAIDTLNWLKSVNYDNVKDYASSLRKQLPSTLNL